MVLPSFLIVKEPHVRFFTYCALSLKVKMSFQFWVAFSLFQVELIRRDYYANEGWETFLSYEDPTQDILVGLLRLRKPSEDVFR